MPVSPVNVARVSQNLRAFNLLATVQSSQLSLFRSQNQLATGLKFQASSEDPVGAATAALLDRRMAELEQVANNVRTANAALLAGETAAKDAIDLMLEANSIASQTAGDTLSGDERSSLAVIIESIIEQMVAIGNRRHLDTNLFSGHVGGEQPFDQAGNGVIFRGDSGQRFTIVETDFSQDAFTISGEQFFNAVSQEVRGVVDLNPALTLETRISDLRGTTGDGIRLGPILVSDGLQQVQIDLAGVATMGDLLDKLNAEMPATLTASLGASGISIAAGAGIASNITISNVGANQTASDLGIEVQSGGIAMTGADLDPVLTPRTPLSVLSLNAGIDLSGGITIQIGSKSATIDFAGDETVEDLLNRISQTDLGVRAEIAADGRSIQVRNLVSGANMTIGENNGSAATNLGIRSMYADTTLSSLNNGDGINTIDGLDARITTADGTTIDIDLDGLKTIGDVVAAINAAGGGAITAALAAQGNGIVITDNTAGAGTLGIERVNHSPAIDGLGLDVAATGATLVGRDVNPVRVDSTFTALMELRDALLKNDKRAITAAGTRLDSILGRMHEAQGRMASQARNMVDRETRVANEVSAARVLLSDVRDVDIAEAVVRFQQVQTALQANLATASRVLNLSLIDFLR